MAEEKENNSENKSEQSEQTQQQLVAVTEQLKILNAQTASQKEFNETMVTQIQSYQQEQLAKVTRAEPKEDETMLDLTPAELETRISAKLTKQMEVSQQLQLTKQSTLSQIVQEYPEANQQGSDMYKKFIEINNNLGNLRDTAEGYEIAASRAAKSLGILPQSLRSEKKTDNFTIPGNTGAPSGQDPKRGKLTDKSLALAELMGLDVENKEQVKRLEQRTQRRSWKRYE